MPSRLRTEVDAQAVCEAVGILAVRTVQGSGGRMIVELPWPSPKLHPNARVHWSVRSKAAKAARRTAALFTIHAQGRNLRIFDGMTRVPVALTFHPPDRRKRDTDGMLSACKSQLDGLADALMVNDNLFDLALQVREPVKGGKIIVEIK